MRLVTKNNYYNAPPRLLHAKASLATSAFASSLSDRNTRPTCEHPCSNVHGLKLLEQKFGRIRDVYLSDLGLVFARAALERLLREVPVAHISVCI